MNKRRFLIVISWTAVAVCMAVIFALSHQEAVESQNLSDRFAFLLRLPFGSFIVRKGAHFLEFAGLAVLVFNALCVSCRSCRPLLSFIITALYAASDEFHQLFIEGRACRFFDWLVDCSGAACAIIVLYIIILIVSKIKRRRLL